MAKVLNGWRRYRCYLMFRQFDSANPFAFSMLQMHRPDPIGKPVAPFLTGGAWKFAPRRVMEAR